MWGLISRIQGTDKNTFQYTSTPINVRLGKFIMFGYFFVAFLMLAGSSHYKKSIRKILFL